MQLSHSIFSITSCQSRQNRQMLGALWLAGFCLWSTAATELSTSPTATEPHVWHAEPGPWGSLRVRSIQLSAPPTALETIFSAKTHLWGFGTTPWEDIYAFLESTGLTSAQWAEISAPSRRKHAVKLNINAIEISPELLLSLSAETRGLIYDRLAQFPENDNHAFPTVLPPSANIETAALNPKLRQALQKLIYIRHNRRCLTDAWLLEDFVQDHAELNRLKRFLSSSPSLIVELTRESLNRREEVVRYWSHNQNKSAANFVRMLADSPDMEAVDVTHLLPLIPQTILNQFPDEEAMPSYNCFWASLNFFSENPNPQFIPYDGETQSASERAQVVLDRDYETVYPPYKFGDVIGLIAQPLSSGGAPELIHTMSYIADDIVLTKNGVADSVPTVLMRIPDVIDRYAWPGEISIQGYREKPITPPMNATLLTMPIMQPRERTEIPGGYLEFQVVQLTAPDAAIEAYLDSFITRRWTIRTHSRGAFVGRLMGLEISPRKRAALFAEDNWSDTTTAGEFIVTPPPKILGQLTPEERRQLYRELARWSDNKPELWPLYLPADINWAKFTAAGIPPAFIKRVRELSYPFRNGYALSDFSVLAHEFPRRETLRKFLQIQSTVPSTLPRLKLTRAKSISQTLAYWTSDHHNPFAQPLLEALLESESEGYVDLVSIMPAAIRRLSFNIEPGEVSHDIQRASYLISANLASPSHRMKGPGTMEQWFEENFRPVKAPYRYGDILTFSHSMDQILDYACAFIGADVIFARDPVGLGLWRFMREKEILGRNPHFSGGSFEGLRYTPVPDPVKNTSPNDR